jgi:hypothetical protein
MFFLLIYNVAMAVLTCISQVKHESAFASSYHNHNIDMVDHCSVSHVGWVMFT